MRITLHLDAKILRKAKRAAEQRGETLNAMIERGLRPVLAGPRPRPNRKRVTLPVSRAGGVVAPGVDLNDSAALLDRMENI